jgi:hypothetical protein
MMSTPRLKADITGIDEMIEGRWQKVRKMIEDAPEDDRAAQWSAVTGCISCGGPALAPGIDWSDLTQTLTARPTCTRCQKE